MKTVKNENEEGNKMKKTGLFQKVRKNRIMLLMLLPAIAYTVIFSYIPMTGIVLAFKKYNYHDGIYGSPWVGLKNFDYMIVSDKLWSLTRNTLLYNIAFIVLGIVFEVGFAIMLSEINNRIFKKVSQTVMFLPYFISWVVVSTVMLNIFGDNGVVNNILASIGGEPYSIYSHVKTWPIVMVCVRLWKQTGYGTVVYLAAIAGISTEMYEAAEIDGANKWQRFLSITLPCLSPIILYNLVMQTITAFMAFTQAFVITQGGPNDATNFYALYVYNHAFKWSNMGYASAMSWLMLVLISVITLILFKSSKFWVFSEADQ